MQQKYLYTLKNTTKNAPALWYVITHCVQLYLFQKERGWRVEYNTTFQMIPNAMRQEVFFPYGNTLAWGKFIISYMRLRFLIVHHIWSMPKLFSFSTKDINYAGLKTHESQSPCWILTSLDLFKDKITCRQKSWVRLECCRLFEFPFLMPLSEINICAMM